MPFESQLESIVLQKEIQNIFNLLEQRVLLTQEKKNGSNTNVGGTGEYAKIKGRCNYEVEYKENSELIVNKIVITQIKQIIGYLKTFCTLHYLIRW